MVSNLSSQYGSSRVSDMWQNLLKTADTDGDGKISKAELTAVQSGNQNSSGPSADDIFSQTDSDGDGYLTSTEFSTQAEKMGPPPGGPGGPPPSAEDLFKTADSDSDGKVTLDELTSALPDDQKSNAASIFKSMDTDGDGSVTQSEFTAAMKKKQEEMSSQSASDSSSGTATSYSQTGEAAQTFAQSLFSAQA